MSGFLFRNECSHFKVRYCNFYKNELYLLWQLLLRSSSPF